MYTKKAEELYILSYKKGLLPFSQLRMKSSEGFNWPKTHPNIMRISHNQQLGQTWLILILKACYDIWSVLLKWNESGFRPPLCTYRLNWARRTSWGWWDEMIEMTLSSRHRTRNSSPVGLRPSTLPLGHGGSPQYWLLHVDGEETFFVSFKPSRPGTEPRTLAWKAAVLTTTLGPPPWSVLYVNNNSFDFHQISPN